MRESAAGDPEAFAALYDRLAVRLLGAARTMTGSAADAEDVVQDVFVDLARGRARLAAGRPSVSGPGMAAHASNDRRMRSRPQAAGPPEAQA